VGDAAAPTVRRPGLVGRDAELAHVARLSAGLGDGPRGLVARGAPGIGKTALWRAGLELLRDAGHRLLVSRPAEEEKSLGAGGLVDLFEETHADVAALLRSDDPMVRGRTVLESLRGLARHGPVVVCIDDVQWLDSVSARALRFALRRLDEEPVGVLATQRAGPDIPDVLAVRGTFRPGRFDVVELGPLSLGALRRVLAESVESISRPMLARIHAASGGNPLFAIELARSGWGSAGKPHLPESLLEILALRLESVSDVLGPVLETAAALGSTSVAELRAVLPDTDVETALEEGEAQRLLVVEEDLAVRFAHPLIGSAVYGRTSPLARRSLHAHLARSTAEPELRARHLALSTDDPDATVAEELERAAARARSRGAPDVSADFAGHSLRLTPPGEKSARHRRALLEVEQLAAAGEVRRALDCSDRLVASLAPGQGRVEALVQRAELEDDDRATAERLLLGALEEAAENQRLRGSVLHRLAQLRRLRIGDVAGAIVCAREALELAESVGDPTLETPSAAYLAHLETLAGRPRRALMGRAVALESEIGGLPISVGPRSLLAKHRLWAGDLAGARSLIALVHAEALRAGNEMKRPQHSYDLTLLECAAGNLFEAERVVREGTQAALDAENTYAERELLYPLALVQALTGQGERARATSTQLRDEALRHGVRPLLVRADSVLGLLALSEGDVDGAVVPLVAAVRLLDEMGFAHPGCFPVAIDAVEALARSGDLTTAESVLERLRRQADAVDSACARAGALRAHGILLLAAGGPRAAETALGRAFEASERLGFRLEAARAALGRGQALLRDGRRTLAAETLVDARARFAEMGAALWEARAVEELERAAPGRAAGELTSTERSIARLVADGRKNREVAQSLFMSVPTVEAHLTRMYRKLDIRSRSELTRLVTEGTVTVTDA